MKLRSLTISVAVLALFVSCTAGTEGIFASIEREEKIQSDGGLPIHASATHMAELSGRYYIAGGGSLFQRSTAETAWSGSSIQVGNTSYRHVSSVGVAGTTLWAVATPDATAGSQLFSSADGSSWSNVAVPNGELPYSLVPIRQSSNGYGSTELFLVTKSSSGFQYVYLIAGSSVTVPRYDLGFTVGTSSYGTPVTAAVAVVADYYVANESRVFHLSAGPTTNLVTNLPVNSGYSGLLLLSDGVTDMTDLGAGLNAYLSTKSGGLYWGTISSDAWTNPGSKTDIKDNSSDTVTLGQIIYQSATGREGLWIGTLNGITNDGAGYASLSTNHSFLIQPPANTISGNYGSSVLPKSQVPLFFRASSGRYFLGTVGQGLWTWDSTTAIWKQQ